MRTLRMPFVGMVILALVGGLSVTVSAQGDDEALTVTHVTGKQSSMSMTSEPQEWEDGDVLYRRGLGTERTVEWSDPRLPSRLLADTNENWHVSGDGAAGGGTSAVRLVGEEGDWAGTGYGLIDTLDPESSVGLFVLAGEGAYEGLWVMLVRSLVVDADGNLVIDADNQVTSVYEGYIYESELPPMPDPIGSPLSPAAVADVEEPAPVAFVTGTVVEQFEHPGPGDREEAPPDSVRGWMVSAEKYGVIEQVIEWSDPRLPVRHWMNLDLAFVLKPSEEQGRAPEGALVVTTSNLLEGPEGTATACTSSPERVPTRASGRYCGRPRGRTRAAPGTTRTRATSSRLTRWFSRNRPSRSRRPGYGRSPSPASRCTTQGEMTCVRGDCLWQERSSSVCSVG